MDWFPWYPERYKNKTLHLTAEQDGIYRRLIDHYMETRQPLPDNNHALARISGVSGECFEHASSIIRAFFKQEKGGLLSHETCNQLLDEQDNQAKFRSERAEKAANKRWQNQKDTCSEHASSNARAMLGDATITVNNNSNSKVSNNIIAPDGVFEDVWRDFVTHRKAKKAPVTNTALAAINREAVKAGIGLQEALETIVNRGWTGFKAEWIKETRNGNNSSNARQLTVGNGSPAGEQGGSGYGGRKSQTELYGEATERIIARRKAKWEADNPGKPFPSEPALPAAATDIRDVEEVRRIS
jgi:uncharacterized protein YdaU (DUF1376 family)